MMDTRKLGFASREKEFNIFKYETSKKIAEYEKRIKNLEKKFEELDKVCLKGKEVADSPANDVKPAKKSPDTKKEDKKPKQKAK